METWFIILLAIIIVVAVTLLLFVAVAGDDDSVVMRKRHKRGKFINDKTAVIYQAVRNATNPENGWRLFSEYFMNNQKEFLLYVPRTVKYVNESFFTHDIESLKKSIKEIREMKLELKDELEAQKDCLESLGPEYAVDFSAWFFLTMNSCFTINDNMRRVAEACLRYREQYDTPIPEYYAKQLEKISNNICDICDNARVLTTKGDTDGLRELRRRANQYKAESYDVAQRLFDLLHDPKRQMERQKRMSLLYTLNAIQECHCLLATLRRMILANMRISMGFER